MADLLPAAGRWEPVDVGESGATLFHDAAAARFAKCADPTAAGDLRAERDRTVWLGGVGVPVASVLDWRVGDDGACLVTRAIPGVTADRLTPDELARAWPAIVRVVRELHRIPVSSCPFDRRLDSMVALARTTVSEGRVQAEFLPESLQQEPPEELLERLEARLPIELQHETLDLVVCHGDLCLPNIVVDPGTMAVNGLIDLGRVGRADRYADIALLLAQARETWPDDAVARQFDRDFAEEYRVDLDDDRRDFYLLLDPLTWPRRHDEAEPLRQPAPPRRPPSVR